MSFAAKTSAFSLSTCPLHSSHRNQLLQSQLSNELQSHNSNSHCVNGTALDWLHWLQSFVTDRSQYIAVGDERSETANLLSGVPQGSILGPLLLALYVSPIDDVICSHGIQYHQYADDLMLYTALATKRFNVLSSLTECSEAVSEWFLQNALLLNPDKTEAVIFGTRQRLSTTDGTHDITVAGFSIHFSAPYSCSA